MGGCSSLLNGGGKRVDTFSGVFISFAMTATNPLAPPYQGED